MARFQAKTTLFLFAAAMIGRCIFSSRHTRFQASASVPLSESEFVELISEQTEQSFPCVQAELGISADGIGKLIERAVRSRALSRSGLCTAEYECRNRTVFVRFSYAACADILNRQKAALRQYAAAFAESVSWMDAGQAALTAYDRLLDRCLYNREGVYADSAYGALICGEAACSGYAEAYLLLCEYAKIPCLLVTGSADGVSHAWNLIQLGGIWYHADPAWDDSGRDLPYHYFLCSDAVFSETHEWNRADYPEAAGGKLNDREIIRSLLDLPD